ncbi:MAG: sel1 repeat family protein [Azonexus sp.]|nr:sel1 repeat family protein [Azonexus sp.]
MKNAVNTLFAVFCLLCLPTAIATQPVPEAPWQPASIEADEYRLDITGAYFGARNDSHVDTYQKNPFNVLKQITDASFPDIRAQAERGDADAQYKLGLAYSVGRFVERDEAQGLAWVHKAAENGNASAQFVMGGIYLFGGGKMADEYGPDKTKATAWFRKAAEQGNVTAQVMFGMLYERGKDFKQDPVQAVTWYSKAAGQGSQLAGAALRHMAARGSAEAKNALRELAKQQTATPPTPEDARQAERDVATERIAMIEKIANEGEAGAQFTLGMSYKDGESVAQDEAKAIAWLSKAAAQGHPLAKNELQRLEVWRDLRDRAEKGDADAQVEVGERYSGGYGVKLDITQAIAWYKKADAQGNADAPYFLGRIYENGHIGVEQDDAQAIAWYRKAAERGHDNVQDALNRIAARAAILRDLRERAEKGDADAQLKLGAMHQSQRNDDRQAVVWYAKAAEQGNAAAQYALGQMYQLGRGLEKDETKAAAWFRQAAEQGKGDAQATLGKMYEEGRGVAQDDAQAIIWLRKAAAQGNDWAKSEIEWLEAKADQRKAASKNQGE